MRWPCDGFCLVGGLNPPNLKPSFGLEFWSLTSTLWVSLDAHTSIRNMLSIIMIYTYIYTYIYSSKFSPYLFRWWGTVEFVDWSLVLSLVSAVKETLWDESSKDSGLSEKGLSNKSDLSIPGAEFSFPDVELALKVSDSLLSGVLLPLSKPSSLIFRMPWSTLCSLEALSSCMKCSDEVSGNNQKGIHPQNKFAKVCNSKEHHILLWSWDLNKKLKNSFQESTYMYKWVQLSHWKTIDW